MAAAALAVAAALLSWPPRPRLATRVLGVSTASPGVDRRGRRRWWWAAVALPAIAVGGIHLPVLAVGAAALVVLAVRRHRVLATDPDLPLVVDLLGACLRAGAPLPSALRAAAVASRSVAADSCVRTAASLDAGATAADAWAPWTRTAELTAVSQVCQRVSASGAAAADELARVAGRIRVRQRAAFVERAQRAGTWVVVPLGLCFLPAFVLVGVVPIGLGLAATWR